MAVIDITDEGIHYCYVSKRRRYVVWRMGTLTNGAPVWGVFTETAYRRWPLRWIRHWEYCHFQESFSDADSAINYMLARAQQELAEVAV